MAQCELGTVLFPSDQVANRLEASGWSMIQPVGTLNKSKTIMGAGLWNLSFLPLLPSSALDKQKKTKELVCMTQWQIWAELFVGPHGSSFTRIPHHVASIWRHKDSAIRPLGFHKWGLSIFYSSTLALLSLCVALLPRHSFACTSQTFEFFCVCFFCLGQRGEERAWRLKLLRDCSQVQLVAGTNSRLSAGVCFMEETKMVDFTPLVLLWKLTLQTKRLFSPGFAL